MKTNFDLKKDSTVLIGISLVNNGAAFLLFMIIAKYLSVDEVGKINFFMSILVLFTVLGSGGLLQYLPALARKRKLLHESPPVPYVGWAMIWVSLASIVSLLMYTVGVFDKFEIQIGKMMLTLPIYIFFSSFVAVIIALFIGYRLLKTVMWISLLIEFSRCFVIFLLIQFNSLSWSRVIQSFLIVYIFSAVFLFLFSVTWIKSHKNPSKTSWKLGGDHKLAAAFLLPASSHMFLPKWIILLCGMYFTSYQTGLFSIAILWMSIFPLILTPLQTAYLGYDHSSPNKISKNELMELIKKLVLLIVILSILVGICAYFGTIMFFDDKFADSLYLLPSLIFLFAMDAPRCVFDVIWTSKMAKWQLNFYEISKYVLIGIIFYMGKNFGIANIIWSIGIAMGFLTFYKGWRIYKFSVN